MFRISLITLLICGLVSSGFAQDSLKKQAAPVKPYSKYKTYRYNPYSKYHKAKADSAAAKATLTPAAGPLKVAPIIPVNTDKSLNGQYQAALAGMYHYQQPPVIALWKSFSDTLKVTKNSLKAVQGKLASQNKTIDSLKTDINTLNEENAKIGGISFVGINMSKTSYNLIMWGLVLFFGLAAVIVILRSGSHSREAKYRIKLYSELEEEFKVYKTKANDKEKKLARELQTERNKLDELLGR